MLDGCVRRALTHAAIVANTWLALRPQNRSQGVDIDLDALRDTQRKLGGRRVQLLQSPAFAQAPHTREIPAESADPVPILPAPGCGASAVDGYVSTWAEGQATARLDRRIAKRQAQARASAPEAAPEPRIVLVHSDVLDLPIPPPVSGEPLEAPDLVASLNYAMAYFHDRATLLQYLRGVVKSLRPHTGVFITDMFGGPPTGEEYEDQAALWERFWHEPGFLRSASDAQQKVLDADCPATRPRRSARDDLQVFPAPTTEQCGTRAEWPRGKLKLVRTGQEHGGFEYWREDGPVDYATNRFRMSLSFRFRDGSWLRDVFSYDFRIWSLKEVRRVRRQLTQLSEAMEEAGFARVRILVLPRNDIDSYEAHSSDESDVDDAASDDFAALLRRTEREERERRMFHVVEPGEKVFSSRSFATYIVAKAP